MSLAVLSIGYVVWATTGDIREYGAFESIQVNVKQVMFDLNQTKTGTVIIALDNPTGESVDVRLQPVLFVNGTQQNIEFGTGFMTAVRLEPHNISEVSIKVPAHSYSGFDIIEYEKNNPIEDWKIYVSISLFYSATLGRILIPSCILYPEGITAVCPERLIGQSRGFGGG